MRRRLLCGLTILFLLSLCVAAGVCADEVQWKKSFQEGMSEAADTGKPVMIDFYTEWCGWCKKLDKDVYTDPEVAKLSEKFVCIKLDADKDRKTTGTFSVKGFPTIVFTDAKGKEIKRVVGYKPTEQFKKAMEEVINTLKK